MVINVAIVPGVGVEKRNYEGKGSEGRQRSKE
jgi:hypothetical protein